jgi:hypothetical protein
MKSNWIIYFIFLAFLFGACSGMAAGFSHWPAFLIAVAIAICVKAWGEHKKKILFPEMLFYTAVILIIVNLAWLYFSEAPMPY